MHVRDLAELAALVCIHHRHLASASPTSVDDSLESYWIASRCRLDRWCRSLRHLTQTTTLQPARPWSPGATRLVEEIFVSEILTRSVAAVLSAHDQYHHRSESEPVGRNVLAGHLDARRRALRILASPAHAGSAHAEALGALVRRCDRWSDLLLAYLVPTVPVDQYAADPARVQDFALDARSHAESTAAATDRGATTMLLAGVQMSFQGLTDGDAANADLNVAIAAAVIGCFGPEFFDSHGLLRSAWLERLQAVPDETLALISQWCQSGATTSVATPPRRRW
jgi:hypothetical protein